MIIYNAHPRLLPIFAIPINCDSHWSPCKKNSPKRSFKFVLEKFSVSSLRAKNFLAKLSTNLIPEILSPISIKSKTIHFSRPNP